VADIVNRIAPRFVEYEIYMESYSKPHVIEKKNSPRAASYVSR